MTTPKNKGFNIPHILFSSECGLNEGCKVLLICLLALNERFVLNSSSREWFNISNKELCSFLRIGKSKLISRRKTLSKKKWILYRRGFTSKNSQYSILIDNFVSMARVQNKDTTKS